MKRGYLNNQQMLIIADRLGFRALSRPEFEALRQQISEWTGEEIFQRALDEMQTRLVYCKKSLDLSDKPDVYMCIACNMVDYTKEAKYLSRGDKKMGPLCDPCADDIAIHSDLFR